MSSAASKAAATRTRNAELRRQEEARLVEETEASGGRSAKQKAGKAWAQMIPSSRQTTSVSRTKERAAQHDHHGDTHRIGKLSTQGKRLRLRSREEKIPRAPELEEGDQSAVEEDAASDEDTHPRKRCKSDRLARHEEAEDEENDEEEMDGEEDDEQNGSQDDEEDDGMVSNEILETERPTIITRKAAPKSSAHRRLSAVIEDSDDDGEEDDGEEDKGGRPGKGAADYDENDRDVEIASQSRVPSRAATLPPTARSEGDTLFLSGDEDESESFRAPRKTLRDIVFNSERPHVRRNKNALATQGKKNRRVLSAPTGNQRKEKQKPTPASESESEDPNAKYPEHAVLRPRRDGKSGILLREQHSLIKRVVDRAISQVTRDMVVDCAWPEAAARIKYGMTKLVSACTYVSRTYPQASDIEDRVKGDDKFAKVLIELVVDRLATHRHKAAKCAHSQISFFKLGLGEECRERVNILSSMHAYIFPGRWAGADHMAWHSERREPYLNPAIIETLKSAYFANEQAIGYRFKDDFKVLSNGETRFEIPPSLLALAATAVYHSLYEYRMGAHEEIPFHGNVFLPTYKSHIRTLQKLEQERPSKYHEILRRVYDLVATRGDHRAAADEQDAFNLIDIE